MTSQQSRSTGGQPDHAMCSHNWWFLKANVVCARYGVRGDLMIIPREVEEGEVLEIPRKRPQSNTEDLKKAVERINAPKGV